MIAIAYCSGSGHTRRLADLIAEGVREDGAEVALVDVEALDADAWARLDAAEAIIFGTPTYMGSAAAAMKVFMDETSDRWTDQVWADRIAAGFTVATYASGDKLMTLQQLAVFAAQHGMIWIGQHLIGPKGSDIGAINWQGSNLGLMATSSRDKTALIDPGDAATARAFGVRIASAAWRWREG
jgi:NAD(P)H dehydrogenase (quinone)